MQISNFDSLVEANTTVVSLLRRNKKVGALLSFLDGIKRTIKSLECFIDVGVRRAGSYVFGQVFPHNRPLTGTNHGSGNKNAELLTCTIVDCPDLTNDEFITSPASVFAIFNRAIVVSWDSILTTKQEDCGSLVAAVSFYNIGLLYHREGVERGCTEHLAQALKEYEMAYATLLLNELPPSTVLDLVLFGLANNMGHIYAHFFDTNQSRNCRNYLIQRINNYSELLSREDFSFVSVHILLADPALFQLAPAA